MKKWKNALVLLAAFGTLAGCQMQDRAGEREMLQKDGNTINVSDRTEMYNKNGLPNGREGKMTNFGYVRHTKAEVTKNGKAAEIHAINREQLANIISSMAVQLPHVQDAAALVTDEEVMVAYQTDSKKRSQTADQVKRTALSVVPAYFHIYVADNPEIIKQLQSYSRFDSNTNNINQIMNQTIKEMKRYPQGGKAGRGTNANNEDPGEMDKELDVKNGPKSMMVD
ncbi:YhcN/YlaJ family sporulation lipoprotein [Metabacillus sp. GX 13764]|uniref:YhcN/YlaJ family sporulation lipoprotein n=1 Tax=Metabacillus kandeliae TaxID=2900151 RepID=UPI001E29567A|nr:YhcN/YlaJ family sporulation lipoprotein [Metabacillus kandeliae]MCD7036264.1 YhcN/YlaJ family sporulation lipoprotein [Metabacillus kandeliae]